MKLADRILEFQQDMLPRIPDETLNTLLSTTQDLVNTGQAQRALAAGDRCPDFTLPGADGKPVSINERLADGPVILSFYRGAWCPYCNLEIRALAEHHNRFMELGASLIAVSPQKVDRAAQQSEELDLHFDVLSDVSNEVARRFGLAFSLADSARPIYDSFEFDVPGHNGDDRYELPIPATYIIDADGKIRYAFVDADYTRRLEPSVIIEQLEKLAS